MAEKITRRALMGAGSTLAAIGAVGMLASQCVPTEAPAATVTPIEAMFARWLAVRDDPRMNDEAEFGNAYQEYVALQKRITSAEPVTARDVAIQLVAETDHFGSDITAAFRKRIVALALGGRV